MSFLGTGKGRLCDCLRLVSSGIHKAQKGPFKDSKERNVSMSKHALHGNFTGKAEANYIFLGKN